MIHPCNRGWVGRCTEDDLCRVKDFEAFSMSGIKVMGHREWLSSVGIGVGIGSLG